MRKLNFITIEDLLEMFENKERFKLVEVLTRAEYDKGHIPKAINIPLDELETLAKQKLRKTDTIVVYCASYTCHASTKAARTLQNLGYQHVLDFKGGKRWWQHAGFELKK
jgi:rhodanese-related sulfurtransferase